MKNFERPLIPLLWVCHNFRAVAQSRFFLNCELCLFGCNGEINEDASVSSDWSSSPRAPVYPTHHLAKSLEIELSAWEVFSGEAIEMLSVAPYDGIVFPQVNKLTIIIHYSAWRERWKHSYDGLLYDIKYNINKFIGRVKLGRVKQMVPRINNVVIDNRYESMYGKGV
ncbi:hypothetical protein GGI19_006335, partial [Coemansia pectinata]